MEPESVPLVGAGELGVSSWLDSPVELLEAVLSVGTGELGASVELGSGDVSDGDLDSSANPEEPAFNKFVLVVEADWDAANGELGSRKMPRRPESEEVLAGLAVSVVFEPINPPRTPSKSPLLWEAVEDAVLSCVLSDAVLCELAVDLSPSSLVGSGIGCTGDLGVDDGALESVSWPSEVTGWGDVGPLITVVSAGAG